MENIRKFNKGIIILLFLIFLVFAGCNSSQKIYEGSSIDEEFPVPVKAIMTDDKSNSPNIIYVRYNIDRSEIPSDYFSTISKRGWKSIEGYGTYRKYKKGEKEIGMTIHNEFITLSKEKE